MLKDTDIFNLPTKYKNISLNLKHLLDPGHLITKIFIKMEKLMIKLKK